SCRKPCQCRSISASWSRFTRPRALVRVGSMPCASSTSDSQAVRITYDPKRVQGVTLYREEDRAFARGDRVQFTAPDRQRHVANHELGTIEKIEAAGDVRVRLDSGRTVALNRRDQRHLDNGYAVTSHSSQGQTADRVLVHVETDRAGEKLVNQRLAYVAVSRGRYDAQLYTNDKGHLAEQLSRDVSHRPATKQIGRASCRERGE